MAGSVYEKNNEATVVSQAGSDSERSHVDWTAEEEKALVRKIDRTVMPLLVLGFFVLQLDRGNIGNALTDYFLGDVGITQNQFNVGQQLLSVGIVLLEIPSNLVLYRLGPSKWIGAQMLAWGFVATFQAFQKGLGAFLSTRLLLGLCEAGFIPAGLYTVTRWYKKDETSKRFSWFFIGNMTAGASSGLIAYGILHMRGIAGLAGWQWLFIGSNILPEGHCLEGILTIVVGLIFIGLFPDSVTNPVSVLGIRAFTPREAGILARRVLVDDPTKVHARSNVTRQELMNVLTDWRLLPHIVFTVSGLAPATTMGSYAPTLVRSFGFDRLKSNALVSIGSWIMLVVNIAWGTLADKIRLRGPLVTLGIFIFWVFTLSNRLLVDSHDGHKRFATLVCGIAFSAHWHPVNGSWMALNAGSAGERSVTMAVLIIEANTSGIIGSQLFRQGDSPLYHTGWTAILALVSVALALVASVVANVQYFLLNGRRIAKDGSGYKYKG